ncbi:MAG: AbgT family transporter [Firmicutes bacterium]|nr:AbgT family transporter [Bacillota bacterium]
MKTETSRLERFIRKVEIAGNKLPHPWLLFVYLTVIVLAVAHIFDGVSFKIPGTDEVTTVVSLLNADGFRYMVENAVSNFVKFPPIGLVIPMAIGIGICEEAGLFDAAIVKLIRSVPSSIITAVLIFAAINSNIASDARYALIIPVSATLYLSLGRNPLLGIIAAYAGASAALSCNLLIVGLDATLAGLTEKAAQIIPHTASAPIHPAANWYFLAASTFLLTFVGTYVTEKIIAPMLEKEDKMPDKAHYTDEDIRLSPEQQKGLRYAAIALAICILVLLVLTVPQGALLRDTETGGILPKSPLMTGLIPIIMIIFISVGIAYGFGAGTIKSSHDIGKFMTKGVSSMSSFVLLAFFCAQFTNYFSQTNLATFIAVSGANGLEAINLTGIPLLIVVILFVSTINILVGSSTAKWAMMAPILVPMLGLIGYAPGFSQAVYRVADSVTNTINPLSTYYPFIIAYMQRYDAKAGIGTTIAYQLPYALAFMIAWTALLIAFYVLGLPFGPGISALL